MFAKRDELKTKLKIDVDYLDRALIEQPSLFYTVADQFAMAVAERDAAKLELDEKMAELDQDIRAEAVSLGEKVTEASIQRRLATLPTIKDAERNLLEGKAKADEWQALKEAYQQRSFMLRELVALQLAQLNNLSLERGAHGAHRDLSNAAAERVERVRRERA
jgi:hypothetical protein